MNGRGIERLSKSVADGMFNLVEHLLHAGVETLNGLNQDELARIAIRGDFEPKTFAPRNGEEEGGHSRFLPALSMGVAAVKRSGVEPVDVFEEMHGYLKGLKGGVKKSEKAISTRSIVHQLMGADLEILEGVGIEECPHPSNQISRTRAARAPLENSPPTSLIVPLHWRIFREEQEISDEYLSVPLWAAVTGGRRVEDVSGGHGMDDDPNYSSYKIAYPVRPPDAPKGEGFSKEMPGITFTDVFGRENIELPGVEAQPNIAYRVFEQPS